MAILRTNRRWLGWTLALALLAGCNGTATTGGDEPTGETETPETYAAQIKRLESADVAAEVDAAMARGDKRLVGVMGIGLITPGVPDDYDGPDRGVRIIENTSDAIENDEHMRLQDAAYRYAKQYNELLRQRLAE